MNAFPDLPEHLRGMKDKFLEKKMLFIWDKLIYMPTGEKVKEGFRYFACSAQALTDAFQQGDFTAINALPFALDDEGEPDTSAVCLHVTYTESGSVFAAQPEEYQDYNPKPVAPPLVLFGEEAKALLGTAQQLDQSR
jgi:hypothetical protein